MSELTESTLFNANQYLINNSKRLTEESRVNKLASWAVFYNP